MKTEFQVMAAVNGDDLTDRQMHAFAPMRYQREDWTGGPILLVRARRDALFTRANIIKAHPSAEVRIYEVPLDTFPDDDAFTDKPDADGVFVLAGPTFTDLLA